MTLVKGGRAIGGIAFTAAIFESTMIDSDDP
jgi:hypothetical protein